MVTPSEEMPFDLQGAMQADTTHATKASSCLDPERIDQLREIGGDKLVAGIFDLYLKHTPERIEELTRGVAAGDCEAVSLAAHSLASSALNVGAGELHAACVKLETDARAGKEAFEIRRGADTVRVHFGRVRDAVQSSYEDLDYEDNSDR